MVKPISVGDNEDEKVHIKHDVPADLQLEIISHLPEKSLIRLRSVCKAWNAATTNKFFLDQHSTRRNLLDECFMFEYVTQCGTSMIRLENDILDEIQHPKLLHLSFSRLDHDFVCSYNGLLCLRPNVDSHNVFLCNPFYREVLKLPPLDVLCEFDLMLGCYWAVFGFGFNLNSKEYKVVAAKAGNFYPKPCKFNPTMVCSIPLNGPPTPWKPTGPRPIELVDVLIKNDKPNNVQVNNKLHWLAIKSKNIVTFDLSDNQFQLMPIHDVLDIYRSPTYGLSWALAELNGYLSVVAFYGPSQRFVIFTMKEYGKDESWIVKLSFRTGWSGVLDIHYKYGSPKYYVWRDGKLIICLAGAIIRHDMKSNRCTPIFIRFRDMYPNHFIGRFLPFRANLSPLHGAVDIEKCKELFNLSSSA